MHPVVWEKYQLKRNYRLASRRRRGAVIVLWVKHVCKTFNAGTINEKRALIDVDLHLAPGDFVTVIGGNGAGKSTLMNMIAGVYPIDSGTIELDGVNISSFLNPPVPSTWAAYSRTL